MNSPAIIKQRRDTATNWSNTNPVLYDGQLGIDTTNKKIKIGDGTTAWNSLPYLDGSPSDADYLVKTANSTLSAERVVTNSTSITANWTTAGQVAFERAAFTGDVTASANSNALTLSDTAVTPGSYTAANVTVDSKGRITAASNGSVLSSSTSSTQNGYFGDIYLYDDSTPSHYLQITNSANLTKTCSLSFNVNDNNRAFNLSGDLVLANNFSTSGNFALTLTTTASTNVTLPTTGTLATTGNLSQFAATTSAQLAGVISDETGSGVLVFGTSPAITTSITTGSSSFDVFNTTATTINAFGAATTLTVGATTGTTTIRNDVSLSKSITSTEGYKIGSGAINAQTGTSYTLLSSDNGKIVTCNNANAITVTVPSGLGAGFTCTILALGDGKVTLSQTSQGTTLNWYGGTGNIAIAGKYGSAALVAYVADTFSVSGTLQ